MTARHDPRNRLNDLTGKEWLKLTKSFWMTQKCGDDLDAMKHPAPFLIKDTMKLITMFTKAGMTVLDPFVGSGTTLIAAANTGRQGIGIDLNPEYKVLAEERLHKKGFKEGVDYNYLVGDAKTVVPGVVEFDYVVTSPPYHNILRNAGAGLRAKKDRGYRTGARLGVEYYSSRKNDLGNKETYSEFIEAFTSIMREVHDRLKVRRYCTIVISDFTVNKKEVCVQGDIVNSMDSIGFEFVGTTVLLQNNKPLYPFGYPYAFKINHHHQNMITFRKVVE